MHRFPIWRSTIREWVSLKLVVPLICCPCASSSLLSQDRMIIVAPVDGTRDSASTFELERRPSNFESTSIEAMPASFALQPTPLIEPNVAPQLESARATGPAPEVPTGTSSPTSVPAAKTNKFTLKDFVSGSEAQPRSSADLGSLLRKSSGALSTSVQSRTPIMNDPRIRGSRIGSLAASGSYWVPARIDLDTVLSKFDSRQVDSVTIIPGPYTSLLGPGFGFTDIQLRRSPRYNSGFESHGSSGAEYRDNGNQILGQQSVDFGSTDWGGTFSYVFRDGDSYESGNGIRFPSSYRSQEMVAAFGRDWEHDSIEVGILRLDQTDVLFPGYVFDLDFLVTDGYDITHTRSDTESWDAIESTVWYNRTRFAGNAQNPEKRPFFPPLDTFRYVGVTDVDSMSTGYRQSFVLGSSADSYRYAVGHDLRFIKQELNEVASGEVFPFQFTDRNSPIPRSFQINPGLFTEFEEDFGSQSRMRLGGRVDYAATDIIEDPANLAIVGLDPVFPTSYTEVLGSDEFAQDFVLFGAFASLERDYSDELTTSLGVGFAERAPNLTELYAAQPFMLLIQNGLNNVTGDPTLQKEKLLQVDLGFDYQTDDVRSGFRVFHGWGFDYITFEQTQQLADQVSLRFVNTDLATLAGFESFGELLPKSPVTPYYIARFVDGRDRTRNGDFATTEGAAGAPSRKIQGAVRGSQSNIVVNAGDSEALPGIPPLEVRLGMRWHDTSPMQRWTIDLSARMVDDQSQVARSLLETPTAGFTTWDLRGVYRPERWRRLLITSGVENLFDRTYREHLDFRTPSGFSVLQPGATFYLGSSLVY